MDRASGAVHLALERGIDEALLLHAVQPAKALVDDLGGEMHAVIALDGDAGVGQCRADERFEIGSEKGHRLVSLVSSAADVDRVGAMRKGRSDFLALLQQFVYERALQRAAVAAVV